MQSGKQEHEGESFMTLHSALEPHGEGKHGLMGDLCRDVFSSEKNFVMRETQK